MRRTFDKNELIFYHEYQDFPKKMISKEALEHKALLFNDKGEEPLESQLKFVKLADSFIIEEEIEHKTKGGFKKGMQVGRPQMNRPIQRNRDPWRKNEPEENAGGFFDDFKGKTDEKQVEKFKRNLELSLSKENSISIVKTNLYDHFALGSEDININEANSIPESLINTPLTADSFFDNADLILGNSTTENKTEKTSKLNQLINRSPNPKIVNIESIFKINDYLQYPREEKLWYIFHTGAKSSFGPLSSPNIKELYDSQMLDGQSELRFIDIYNLKHKRPFEFFNLKEIEDPHFLDSIDVSPLLKVVVSLKSRGLDKKAESKLKTEEKTTNKKPTNINDNKNTSQESKIDVNSKTDTKHSKETNQKITKEPSRSNFEADSIYGTSNASAKSTVSNAFEDKPTIDKIDDHFFDNSKTNSKKSKKVPKGKPVELEVKLGFKTEDDNDAKKSTTKTNQPVMTNPTQQKHVENNTHFKTKETSYPTTKNHNYYDNYNDGYNYYEGENYDQGYNYNNNYYAGGNSHYNSNKNQYWKK